MVGYSRLMQDDDAATVETLTKYRTIFSDFVSRHEGRIVDSPGDNILAEFDSPVEAVQCAVELQREFARRNLQLADHRQILEGGRIVYPVFRRCMLWKEHCRGGAGSKT